MRTAPSPSHCPARTGGTALTGMSSTSWRSKKGRMRSVSSSPSAQASTAPRYRVAHAGEALGAALESFGTLIALVRVLRDAGEIADRAGRPRADREGRSARPRGRASAADRPSRPPPASRRRARALGRTGLVETATRSALRWAGETSRADPRPSAPTLRSGSSGVPRRCAPRSRTTLKPYQCSFSGASGMRSRVGFSPTKPQFEAGMRIEPGPI